MSQVLDGDLKLPPLSSRAVGRTATISSEAASFLASRDRALLVLATGTPLRLAELCALDVADVDWRRERLRVQRRGAVVYVWVAEEALACLEAYLDTRPEPKRSVSGEPLFLSRLRKRLSSRQIRAVIASATSRW